ncbi:hypothetical protein RCL1_007931 [Eukaryota sp. TZLM3-RCL]
MSNLGLSDGGSHSLARDNDSFAKSTRTKLFTSIDALYDATPKYNKLSVFLILIEMMQLLFFVGRSISFNNLFDLNSVFQFSLPLFFTDAFSHDVRTVFFLVSFTLLLTFAILLYFVGHRLSYNQIVAQPLLIGMKIFFVLFSSILSFPLAAFFLSIITCGNGVSSASLSFNEFTAVYGCSSTTAYLFRFAAIFGLSLVVLIYYLGLCFYDSRFNSKRLFARFNSSCHFWMLLGKALILVIFFLFHSRQWMFRITYLCVAFFLVVLFWYRLPFYNSQANLFLITLLGTWAGFAISFIIISIVDSATTPSSLFSTLMVSTITPSITGIVFALTWFRIGKYQKWFQLIHNVLDTNDFITESNSLSDDFEPESIPLSQFNLSSSTSLDVYKLLIGGYFQGFDASIYNGTLKALFMIARHQHPHDVSLNFFSGIFEISVMKNPVLASATVISLRNLSFEIDFSFDQHLTLFRYSKYLEVLRRNQSTGQSVDSSSFLQLQDQIKKITSLHRECLSGLSTFWTILNHDSVELSELPTVLSEVHNLKNSLKNLFQKVLTVHGCNATVLEHYAAYLAEVECDEEKALMVKEQMVLISNSDRSSSQGSTVMSVSKHEKNSSKRFSRAFSVGIQGTSKEKGAIDVLRFSVSIALLVMLLLALTSFLVTTSRLSAVRTMVDQLYELSHIDNSAQYIGSLVTRLFAGIGGNNLTILLAREAEHLSLHLKRLILSSDGVINSGGVCPFYSDADLPFPVYEFKSMLTQPRFPLVITKELVPPTTESHIMSFWTLSMKYALDAALFAKEKSMYISELNIVESLPVLSVACQELFKFTDSFSDSYFNEFIMFQQLVFGAIVVIVIVMAFVLFARSFAKITEERRAILNLFLYIPKTEISRILADSKFDSIRKKKKKRVVSLLSDVDQTSCDEEYTEKSAVDLQEQSIKSLQDYHHASHQSVTIKVDSDSNDELKVVPFSLRIASYVVTFLIISSIFYSVSFREVMDQNVISVSSEYSLAFDVRHAATGLSNIDRILSSNLQLFLTFGDQYYLLKYFDLINSGRRNAFLARINSLDLTSQELSDVAQQGTFFNEIRYVERIIFELSRNVFPIHDSIQDLLRFPYNSSTESNFFRTTLEHPEIDNWYSDPENDVSRMTPSEILEMCRDLVVNSRRLDSVEELQNAIDTTAQGIAQRRLVFISDYLDQLSDQTAYFIVTILVVVLFSLVQLVLFLNTFKRLRFARTFILFLFFVLFLLLALVVYLAVSNISTERHLNNEFATSLEIYDPVISSEYSFNTLRRYIQILQVSGSKFHTSSLSSRLSDVNSGFELLKNSSLCEGTVFTSVCLIIQQHMSRLENIYDKYLNWGLIATKLGLTARNGEIFDSIDLSNISWDMSDPIFALEAVTLVRPYMLTNTLNDLQLDSESMLNLSMAITSSREFDRMSNTIANMITEMRDDVHTEIYSIFNSRVSAILDNHDLLNILGPIAVFLVLLLSVLFFASSSPKRIESAHIKQRIQVPLVLKFTRHYIISLVVLLFALSSFLFLTFYSTSSLNEYPTFIAGLSRRGALINEISSDILYASVNNFEADLYKREALRKSHELRDLHNDIIYNFTHLAQANRNLLFLTDYHDHSKDFIDAENNHGLHSMINSFVTLVDRFISQDLTSLGFATEHVMNELVSASSAAYEMNLQTISRVHGSFSDKIGGFLGASIVFFVVFVVVISVVYFFIFRKMMSTLNEEEQTTFEFLHMLDDEIVSNVAVIRNYLSGKM